MNQLWFLIALCVLLAIPSIYIVWDSIKTLANNRVEFRNGNKQNIKAIVLYYKPINVVLYNIGSVVVSNFALKVADQFPPHYLKLYVAEQSASMAVFALAFILLLITISKGPPTRMNEKLYKSFEFRSMGVFMGVVGQFALQPILLIILAVITLAA